MFKDMDALIALNCLLHVIVMYQITPEGEQLIAGVPTL